MATKVGDVMTRQVVSAREDTPLKELARLMYEADVSGLPVVDADGRLVGIVSEADLLRAETQGPPRRSRFLEWFIDRERLERIERRSQDQRAGDVMTRDVVTTGPDVSVREAAKLLLESGVKRLPVVDGSGRVVGIVSRHDLLSPFLRADDDIRREVVEEVIYRTMWIDPSTIDVRVQGGIVRLAGRVGLKSQKEILLEFVRRVDGVVGVEDHLAHDRDDRQVRPPEPFQYRPAGRLRIS